MENSKDFYRAFEDAHRGSRELIKERVSVYLPFIKPLKNIYTEGIALDIGCGRGEWLELLKDNNINAQGIDLDNGMLEACIKLELDVKHGNGISYLKEQSNESLIIISAFHVVEHISFQELQTLIEEALRVLKPGGLLIMETPNPENIKVATENFYLDPTHLKPIPSTLLSFLPKFYGYNRTNIVRLQEPKGLNSKENINLADILEGVSPDYAVIAQKNASKTILDKFNKIFSKEFGLPLTILSGKFEDRLVKIEAKATQAEAKATQAEAKASEAEAKASEAEARAKDALHHYHMVLNSNSWKLTKPYRILGQKYKWFKGNAKAWFTFAPSSRPRKTLKKLLLTIKYKLNSHPKIKNKLLPILDRYPALKKKIMRIGKDNSLNNHLVNPTYYTNQVMNLSPQAKKIFEDLKKEIEMQKRGK